MNDWIAHIPWGPVLAIVGLAFITLLARAFFLFPERDITLPPGLKRGLRYAPLAALVAIVAPEIVLRQGQLLHTAQDAVWWGTVVATAWYFWRRDVLGTIVSGTSVMLLLRLGLGW